MLNITLTLDPCTVRELIRSLANSDNDLWTAITLNATGETYPITQDEREAARDAWAFFGDGPIPSPEALLSIAPGLDAWVARILPLTEGPWNATRSL